MVTGVLLWSVLVATTGGTSRSVPPRAPPSTAAFIQAPTPAARPETPRSPSDYLGSESCRRCHEEEMEQWERSLHVKMTAPVARALVVGDFSDGARLSAHGRSYTFGRKDGKPYVSVAFGDREPETFTVDYTLGAKRYQGYLSTLPDGRIYVLPVFWHVESRRWLDWKEITPIPDGAHDLRQIWNANCFNCHGTNIAQDYDVRAKRYDSTWTEMGIGCEACHGPGREHVAQMDQWENNPALKPAYDTSAKNRQLTDILKTLSTRSAEPRRTFDTCAYCHGNKTNLFVDFRAGDRYEDFALPFLMSGEIPPNDPQGEFWPDGRPNRFNRPQALTLSGCFQAGAITCTNCHVAHGSSNEHSLKVNIYQGRNGDGLCTQCHQAPKDVPGVGSREPGLSSRESGVGSPQPAVKRSFTGAGLQAHTFHDPESAGSRCINCHMSDVNWRLLTRRRDHTFKAPVPEVTARFGVPNACTTCHDDKTPEWAAAQMDAWWGDGDRRRKDLMTADVMYRAGSDDVSVMSDLARMAVDRAQGWFLRASAADFLARMLLGGAASASTAQSQTSFASGSAPRSEEHTGAPVEAPQAVLNALMGAASDPEPAVRASAVKALAASGQLERVAPALTARLVDTARVVRVRAAEALLSLGVAELPGPAGQALARAQDEYAQSLRTFPDMASNHAALGWLEASRGRTGEAHQALDAALQVDPRFARAYVVKGILAARESRYQDAIDLWRKAQDITPNDPRLADLIAEAQKRQKAGAR
ncbi:MAG: multiheme c-type cytochrome [Vicinamibacterales bacterium]